MHYSYSAMQHGFISASFEERNSPQTSEIPQDVHM